MDESKHEIHSQVDAITAGTASVVNLTAGQWHWHDSAECVVFVSYQGLDVLQFTGNEMINVNVSIVGCGIYCKPFRKSLMKPVKVLRRVPTVLQVHFRGAIFCRVKMIWPISDFKAEPFPQSGVH